MKGGENCQIPVPLQHSRQNQAVKTTYPGESMKNQTSSMGCPPQLHIQTGLKSGQGDTSLPECLLKCNNTSLLVDTSSCQKNCREKYKIADE